MKYYIAVEANAFIGATALLVAALQLAYDNGASGFFEVVTTKTVNRMVIFEREAADDTEYILNRAENEGITIEVAAMKQLAAELKDATTDDTYQFIIDDLESGQSRCFDFGNGCLRDMANSFASAANQFNGIRASTMSPPWSIKNGKAASLEGWDVMLINDKKYGKWQIQMIDDASEIPGAVQLQTDSCAWVKILSGKSRHHVAALKFIQAHNPIEFKTMMMFAKSSGIEVKHAFAVEA